MWWGRCASSFFFEHPSYIFLNVLLHQKRETFWPINTLLKVFRERFSSKESQIQKSNFSFETSPQTTKTLFAQRRERETTTQQKNGERDLVGSSFERAFCCSALFKAIKSFEEKTLNPSHLKDLEFKRRNERSFKSIKLRDYKA